MEKIKLFLYYFDFIGPTPQLYIFKNNRYKSVLSSVFSVIIILFSIIFSILSLNEYLKYESPSIVYSKANDNETIRSVSINDTLLMFQFVDSSSIETIDKTIAYFDAQYFEIFNNGTMNMIPLDIEKCEFGKNMDLKYKDLVRDKNKFKKSIEDFYCINPIDKELSIFYNPNIGYSSINLYLIMKKNDKYSPEKLQNLIVSETDLIDHNNKDNPITNNYVYYLTSSFSSLEFTTINYNLQYIKYESDDGFFFKNSKIINGMSFSDMSFYKIFQNDYNLEKNFESSNITNFGKITIELSKTYFDNYKRIYPRLQTKLAEVMSVINLVLQISLQMIFFLSEKKMSKDIFKYLLKRNLFQSNQQKQKLRNFFKNNENLSERNKMSNSFDEAYNKYKIINNNEIQIKDANKLNIRSINNSKINNKSLKKINHYHIIKSYFCFKDGKIQLINLCHDIIIENMCVENILEKFYNFENKNNLFFKEEKKFNPIISNLFKESNKYIDEKIFEPSKRNQFGNNYTNNYTGNYNNKLDDTKVA